MPHDPGQEHISAEEQFRRLMGTSEEDLPPVPDPAPDMFRRVGEPEQPPPPQPPMAETGGTAEEEPAPTGDVHERNFEKLSEITVLLMSIEDLLEQAVGGD